VVAGDRDRVPLRDALHAVPDHVGHEPHRRCRRVDPGPARGVLLEDVVLQRPRERILRDAAPARDREVEREQDRRRGVDRHRCRHAVERNAVEELLHVLEAADRDAHAAHLACRPRVVGVVSDLRGQIERDRKPAGALPEQVAVAAVRLGGAPEAGVLPHRPEPPPVTGRVEAARERKATRLRRCVCAFRVFRAVDGLASQA
jgi:hypothetical protein